MQDASKNTKAKPPNNPKKVDHGGVAFFARAHSKFNMKSIGFARSSLRLELNPTFVATVSFTIRLKSIGLDRKTSRIQLKPIGFARKFWIIVIFV